MSGAWRNNPAARRRLLDFGLAVRQAREAKTLSQEALALRTNLHRTYVSSIERGLTNPSLLTIYALAEAVGVDVKAFFTTGHPGR